MITENGRIISTMLGVEDHGIFTAVLNLEFDGTGQGFGCYSLDGPIEDKDGRFIRRAGTAFGCEFIMRVLATFGVESWEKLPGTHIRVRRDEPYGQITQIGHIVKDRWFDPKALAAQYAENGGGA